MRATESQHHGAEIAIVPFATRWGGGRLALAGDLPFELELPDAAAGRISDRPPAEPNATAAALWVELLERYFDGEAVEFPLDVTRFCAAHGFTGFESHVYEALAAVPYGCVVSYRDLAVASGRPLAWRAVGNAMAINPLPIILPCHRVIKSDGSMGHYGDDPTWKARLLRHEGALAANGRAMLGRAAPPGDAGVRGERRSAAADQGGPR